MSSIGAQLILNGCYTGSNPGYCSLVDRLPTGFVDDLRNTTNNVGNLETAGLEVGGSYTFSTAYGDFALGVDARQLDTFDVTQACVTSNVSSCLASTPRAKSPYAVEKV